MAHRNVVQHRLQFTRFQGAIAERAGDAHVGVVTAMRSVLVKSDGSVFSIGDIPAVVPLRMRRRNGRPALEAPQQILRGRRLDPVVRGEVDRGITNLNVADNATERAVASGTDAVVTEAVDNGMDHIPRGLLTFVCLHRQRGVVINTLLSHALPGAQNTYN